MLTKDDALNKTNRAAIFEEGKFTGELIGGKLKEYIVNRNFSRSSLAKQELPRMSTLCIKTTNNSLCIPEEYVKIVNIRRASIKHQDDKLLLEVNGAFYINKG